MRRKLSKKILVVLTLLIGASVIVSGTLFTYCMRTTSNHGVGKLWEIKDNSIGVWSNYTEMGDIDISFDTSSMVGGDPEEFQFTIKLSGNSNANRMLKFSIVEEEGVDLIILQGETEILDNGNWTFTPNEEVTFIYRVTLDEYLSEGTYETSLEITKN